MNPSNPTTSMHLYQPVSYQASDGSWHSEFRAAVLHSDHILTWDSAAILSMISFGYICGDRTLVKEIKRQPWLSEIGHDGEPILKPIPGHHRFWKSTKEAAQTLEELLCEEALIACQNRKEIYILLSGGLDSRIVAGILSHLFHRGKLPAKPICITWGLPDSRDVVYGKKVAEILGLDWVFLSLEPKDLLQNIDVSVENLGAMVSAAHLHRMNWFKNVDKNAIVLSGSYGDMVGRAEFHGLKLLELNYLRPENSYDLLKPHVFPLALQGLMSDLQDLHVRSTERSKYITCELEMHAHYTRGILSQAMGLINNYCTMYQMFTHPIVYTYMWSLHPALRNDTIYAALLEHLNPKLARLPWARTNRALRGKTEGADSTISNSFNDYNQWISGPLYDDFLKIFQSDWLSDIGLFQSEKVKQLCESVNFRSIDHRYYDAYDVFVWLSSLNRFTAWCGQMQVEIVPEMAVDQGISTFQTISDSEVGKLRSSLRSVPLFYRSFISIRRLYLRFISIFKYPPEIL